MPVAHRDEPPQAAAYLRNPPPRYPEISRERGEQGRVLVAVVISAEGLVLDARVSRSSGHPRLDDAAVHAVRTWRFVPGKRDGVPVESRHLVPVDFVLG